MKVISSVTVAGLSFAVVNGDILTSTYTGSKGLHELATAQGKYMGTATDNGELTDSSYLAALKNSSEFGMLTPGNAMKWDATEPTQNTFTYTKADAIVSIAEEMKAQVRCHTLLWHQQVPTWVQSLSKREMLSALENHITKVMTHFGDSCYAWDVANEVMGDDAMYRKSFWYNATGTEYITTAFKTANAVKKSLGLKTKLYYNDYNINTVNAKSTAMLDMIQKLLLDAEIGIDGVGFQSHSSNSDTATTDDFVKNLKRFTALGLDVAYTELDVKTSSKSPSEEEQEKQVTVYKDTVAACQLVDKCVGVTIWDFVDTYTWLENSAPLPWYQPAGKGTALVRKRAYDGIAAGWGTSTSTSPSITEVDTTSNVAGEAMTGSRFSISNSSGEATTEASGEKESTNSSNGAETSSSSSNDTETPSSTEMSTESSSDTTSSSAMETASLSSGSDAENLTSSTDADTPSPAGKCTRRLRK